MILDERSSGSFPIFNSQFSIFMRRFILLLGVLLAGLWVQAGEARLLRFPHSVGNKLVFSYAGDLYLVSAGGGTARRLTSHVGYEMFPRMENISLSPGNMTVTRKYLSSPWKGVNLVA